MGDERDFPIPDPPKLDPNRPIDQQNLIRGEEERQQLSSWFPDLMKHYLWLKRFILMPVLFIFVIGLNIWWDWNVMHLLWQSGRANAGFRLSDSVLIALITTSIANFLVLIHIVAKNLFPPRGA